MKQPLLPRARRERAHVPTGNSRGPKPAPKPCMNLKARNAAKAKAAKTYAPALPADNLHADHVAEVQKFNRKGKASHNRVNWYELRGADTGRQVQRLYNHLGGDLLTRIPKSDKTTPIMERPMAKKLAELAAHFNNR